MSFRASRRIPNFSRTIRPFSNATIPGTRHVEYLRENIGALAVELSDEQVARLETIADQVGGHRSIRPEHLGVEAPVAAAS